MPTCFVIMPLTTPASATDQYGGDADHFLHVLEHLFAPAVDQAGYELVRPIMRGADLIQAEIIRHLEEADLVLCDASLLNANVFFELGIRTALDRPIALVKDDKTPTYPFDTTIINHHEYDSSLAPWRLGGETEALARHLKDSEAGAGGRNSLWRYFGLTQRAKPADIENPVEAKLDLLVQEVERLRRAPLPLGSRVRVAVPDVVLRPDELRDPEESAYARLSPALREALASAAEIAYENSAALQLVKAGEKSAVVDATMYFLKRDQVRRIIAAGRANDVQIEVRGSILD